MGEGRIGGDGVFAAADTVVSGDDGGRLRRNLDALAEGGFVRDVVNVWLGCGEGGDGGAEDVHGVAVLHSLDNLQHLLRHLSALTELGVESIQLSLRRKVLYEHEVHDFLEARMLGQVVYLVTAVDETPDVADDEAGLSGLEVDVPEAALQLDLLLGHAPSLRCSGRKRQPGCAA